MVREMKSLKRVGEAMLMVRSRVGRAVTRAMEARGTVWDVSYTSRVSQHGFDDGDRR